MAKEYQTKYQCESCGNHHITFSRALDCCPPGVSEIYICELCEEEYEQIVNAENCCVEEGEETKVPLAYLEENAGQQRLF